MDKILQKIGAFLGSKFNRIYTLFNDKYNELDKNKVDKEEGKELMPSPEGTSDTVFLSETGWREVNTDKIRTHVITIYVPFSNEWDYMGSQEIILDGKDYNREEAESFIYDYFTYNNANAVIRNTNSGISQEGYYIVWKVSGAFSDEKQSLKLFLDIPKNNSILLDPDNENSEFTRYTISLYFTSEGKSYSLDSIGVTPNGTDSFIPKEYLDDKLHNLSSSYLPLIAGPNNPLEGDLYFQNPNGVKLAFKDSNTSYDILKVENIEGGKRVILGFEENLSPDIATGPIFTTVKSQDGKVCTAGLVYESSYGFLLEYDESVGPRVSIGTPSDVDIYHFTDAQNAYIIYDSRNLSINKSFNTDIQVSQNSGTHKHILTYTKYNPTTSTSETVNIDLLPVTDTADGLMTPSYKTVLDKLIPTTGESMSIYGTPSSTWQLTLGTGPKLKNSGGIFELRDNSDNAYTDLILNNITIKGNVTQEGSSFITKAETVEVSDNILLLNRGEVGSGVTKGISGIQVDRGALADYQFIFDESDDRFKVGVEGDLWPVMLRNNESDLSDKFFLSWDASLKRAVTTNIVPETGLLFSGGVSNHPEYDITVAATGSGSIGFGALQANTPWSCTIGYNLNTRDVPSAGILDFATSLNAYRYDKPSVLNMIYFDTYLSPNSIEPYGTSSISLTTGSGDDLIHTKGGQNYIIYDSSNLNIEELATKDDILGLGTVYYPYNGRGQMSITVDGRPVLSNTYGILFKQTGGTWVEGIYMGSHNMIVVGGPSGTNVPVIIYSKLNVNSISTTREQLGLLSYHPTDWTGVSNTQVGVGTTDSQLVLRSNSSDLLHYRDGVHCLIFDSYNFSRNLGTTSLNSSFNHFPMMAAQIKSGDATTDRGYPIQEAGSLVVIPGTYHGSSQIYGTYSTNRWFVRGGSNSLEDPTAHTPWKELATTNHLSNYLPLTGGTLTGSLFIGSPSQNAYNFIRIQRNNYILETTVSEDNGILSFSNLNNTSATSKLKISPGGHVFINDEELAKVSQIPSTSNFLPLSGGVLTRTTAGPVLSLKNTSANKEAYMDFYKGDIRCGYIGASSSNSEDMYLNAYGSRNVIIGTAQGFTRLESGANNLIHRRSGTDYTILDTYNIASLTIQFNGSTNTTYAPNAAKTVNITPSAIGAAPSSHIHTAIQGTYTGSGGSQPPSYVTAGTVRANMMYYNMSGSPYCDWLMMDTYTGSDVPYVTMIGVTKTATPRAFIASGPKGNTSTSSWVRKELATLNDLTWSNITGKPSFATVATSGSYNDLSNRPSIPSAETAATIMSKINSQSEITFSKHVVCSAGAGTSSTSDIRFKNNITSLAPVLSHVLGSPGFFYTWKDEDEVLVGTSAQYWEGRITGLVREINDKSKTKTFSYERYTVILQEALKEEHMLREAEKEEYRKEICSLREELEDLKKLIQKLL